MSNFDWSKAAEPDEKPAKPEAEGFDWATAAQAAPVPVSQEPGDLASMPTEAPEKPVPADPGFVRTVAHNFGQGGLKGGLDEAAGLWAEKMPGFMGGQEPGVGETTQDTYRRYRDTVREQDAGSLHHRPALAMASQVAGDVGSDFVLKQLGIPVTSSMYQTALGVVNGLLASDAELTSDKTNPTEVAKATASATMGGVGAHYLPKIGNRIAGKVANSGLAKNLMDRARNAAADQGKKVADAALSKVREATSAMGGHTSTARRSLEVLREVLTSPAATQEQKQAAQAFLDSDEGVTLLRKVFDNTLDRAPGEMGRLGQAAAARETALKGASQEAIEEGTEAVLSKPLQPIKDRLWNYGTRAIPLAVGASIGGWPGAIAGGITGAAMGNPGTALKNVITNPAVRKFTAESLHKVLVETPEQLGNRAPVLLRLLQRGGPEMALIAYWLMDKREAEAKPQSSEAPPP